MLHYPDRWAEAEYCLQAGRSMLKSHPLRAPTGGLTNERLEPLARLSDCRAIFLPVAFRVGKGYRKRKGRLLQVSERTLPALSCLPAAGQRRQAHHAVP